MYPDNCKKAIEIQVKGYKARCLDYHCELGPVTWLLLGGH